jgi:hypothetical protein
MIIPHGCSSSSLLECGTRVFSPFHYPSIVKMEPSPPLFILLKKIITIICNFLGKKKWDLKSIL